MLPEIPGYLKTFDLISTPLLPIAVLGLIWIGASRMNGSPQLRYLMAAALSVVLIAWLTIGECLGSSNFYFASSEHAPPTLMLGLFIPLIVASLGFRLSARMAKLASAVPLALLVATQIFRLEGGIFLVLWADGRLPWQFALPAGIGDVATAIGAVFVASQLALQTASAKRTTYLWSIFGIADLVVALAMGALTSPGRVHLISLVAPNLLATSYPLVMIPTFAIPLALILHAIVLWRLPSLNPLRASDHSELSSVKSTIAGIN